MSLQSKRPRSIVIVGAGHSGTEAAFALRAAGFDCSVTLVNGEDAPPYQRPPLSKSYILDGSEALIRSQTAFASAKIDLLRANVEEIDCARQTLRLREADELRYDHLILAVGAKRNRLPICERVSPYNLNDLESSERLRNALPRAQRVAIIGAGFIGLEFACVAASLGKEVTVIDRSNRVLERATSPEISRFFHDQHELRGAKMILNVAVTDAEAAGSRGTLLTLSNGQTVEADLVVEAIGVAPRLELAQRSGLRTDVGIVVNGDLLTSDTHISAVGDCAQFPLSADLRSIVLTSIQNSGDQARHVAKRLGGQREHYAVVPWFWSDQASDKLQIAGLVPQGNALTIRRGKVGSAFSIFSFQNQRLASVESVNSPAEHLTARRLLSANVPVSPAQAADVTLNLKELLSA